MTRRSILMPVAVALLVIAFACAMAWETPINPPVEGVAINVGASVWHVEFGDWVSVYRRPAGRWPVRFWQYGRSAPASALAVPLWLPALVLSIWPVWWLNRLRGERAVDAPLVGRAPNAFRRAVGAMALSHLLASYLLYLISYEALPRLVRGTLMRSYAMLGHRLVEAPLELLSRFRHTALYLFTMPGTSPWRRAEVAVYCLSYVAMLGGFFWLLYARPERRRRALTADLCVSCGYDLRATPERCPECGHAVQAAPG